MTTSRDVDAPLAVGGREADTLRVCVEQLRAEADGVLSLSLVAADGRPLPRWEPGAHIDLLLAEGLERQYSLCGFPEDTDRWQVAVLRTPDGRGGSEWVHTRLHQGDQLWVRGPRNRFPLLPARRYVFVAGGIGITPLIPMLRLLAERPETSWRLVYGGRRRASMAFLTELERFGDRVTVWPQDERGLIDLDTALGEPEVGVAIYCCGPEALIEAVEHRCRSWPPGTLHVERFAARDDPDAARGNTSFEVVAARSGVAVQVAGDRTIVDTLAEHGIHIPVSCGEGVCGTCETPVLDGVPDHRDALLTDAEKEAGTTMMPCCSRARTPRLVLDV